MQMIANLFGVTLCTSFHNTPHKEYWSIGVSALFGVQTVLNYFDLYPLMGVKFLDYLDFKTSFNLIKQNEHLTERGQFAITNLKGSMNRSRTRTTWGHLFDFYT